ncbi:hypothetical protein [Pseudomonas sp. RIT623]|uniref:hypothetical protein n=1 Tax=Pseudomonas sp. RIT623 TaxID=2559075 RepID=UPI003557C9D9
MATYLRDGGAGRMGYRRRSCPAARPAGSAARSCHSGCALLARAEHRFLTPSMAGTTLYVSLALAGARHIFIVMYWQRVKAWLCRVLNCEHCLRDCRYGPGGIERRKS